MKVLSRREISAIVGSCCSSLLFGMSYMFTKRVVGDISVFSLLSWRFIFGAIAMTLCAVLGIMRVDFRNKPFRPLLKVTVLVPGVYFLTEALGVSLTSATESGTIIACIPIVTVIASALFLKERPDVVQVAGVLVATGGILVITMLKGAEPTFNILGYVSLFGAVLSYTGFFMFSRKLDNYSVIEKTYAMCLFGAACFTVCALVQNTVAGTLGSYLTLPFHNTNFLISALYLGLGCTTVAFLMSNRSIAILGPIRTSAFAGVSTVVSILSGVFLMGDSFSLLQGVGTALILLGVYSVNFLSPLYRAKRKGVSA